MSLTFLLLQKMTPPPVRGRLGGGVVSARSLFFMVLIFFLIFFNVSTYANQPNEPLSFNSPQQEAQYRALIDEFRCPKCQNQNLAGSDAPIAQDLKQKTYEMVQDGQTDGQIRQYMIARYGDFISYRPPVRPSTWILWFLPPLLLVGVLFAWFYHVRQRQKSAPLTTALTPAEQQRLDALLRTVAPSSPASTVQQEQKP